MENEIFISYSSKDRHLADKLHKSLHTNYFRVFYDQEGLTAGDRWDDQLKNNLNESNHLCVLWSTHSMISQWVWEEINAFKSNINHGLVIFICLDRDNDTNSNFQSIKYIKEKNAYPDQIDDNLWSKVVNKIRKSVYEKGGSKAIKRAVFTITTNKIDNLKVDDETRNLIRPNYAERYADWKPFGSQQNIENTLNDFLYMDINQEIKSLGGTPFHWEDIDWKEQTSRLWLPLKDARELWIKTNVDAVSEELEQLKADLSVLVLDHYSLNDEVVQNRFSRAFNKCSNNRKCLVMALKPNQLSNDLLDMRLQLKNDAQTFYENYFAPKIIENTTVADCYANTLDSLELVRHLKLSLRNSVEIKDRTNTNTIIRNRF